MNQETQIQNSKQEPVEQEKVSDESISIEEEIIRNEKAELLLQRQSLIDPIYFEYSKTHDLKLRNQIIQKNRPLVTYIVNKFYNSKKEHKLLREDLLQEGIIGLISAIEGYKPELGYKFSTYACWWVRQSINNYLLNIEPTIHIPSHVRTANNKILKKFQVENKVFRDFISSYKDSDLSEKMIESINCALRTKYMSSFDEPLKNQMGEGTLTLKDTVPEDPSKGLENVFNNALTIEIVKKALTKLSEREKYILLLRFDVLGEEEIKQEKTAKAQKQTPKENSKARKV